MRVLVALALVPIAGLLGIAIAQEPTQDPNANREMISQFMIVLNSFDIITLQYRYVEGIELARGKCAVNGGPNAHNLATKSAEIYFNTTIPLHNTTQHQINEVFAREQNSTLDIALEKTCDWASKLDNLTRIFVKSFGQCWTLAERNSVDRVNNVMTAALEYLCENGGTHGKEFLTTRGYHCVITKALSKEIPTCLEASGTRNVSFIESFDRTLHPPWSVPVFVPNTDICLEFVNVQRCFVTALQGCENSTPANVINSLFEIAKESVGCGDLLRAQTTPATNN